MGSMFSIGVDSISCIDDTITDSLFRPPQRNRRMITELSLKNNYKLREIEGISTLEINPRNKKYNKLLIFSHGNGTDILGMSSYLESLANGIGLQVVCYDYPGYGLSEGRPSEGKCFEAIDNVINFYRNFYSSKDILLVGQSLGTGVVMHFLATNDWTSPAILISPYKSIPRVIYDVPLECSFRHNTFSTIYKLENITAPIKIFHGKSDELISYTHSQDIYEKLKIKKLLLNSKI